ncbi:MAG: hypothetical protein LBR18_00380 [Tannerella sp.]|jgi:hypothetical protein|nr:hypothetical protein [Tannerella sp.]
MAKLISIVMKSLMHYRMYVGINVLGMGLSLACVIIISRYAYNELMTDRFNCSISVLASLSDILCV